MEVTLRKEKAWRDTKNTPTSEEGEFEFEGQTFKIRLTMISKGMDKGFNKKIKRRLSVRSEDFNLSNSIP